jgi:beta-galactosidase
VCVEALDAQRADPFTTVAELGFAGPDGAEIPRAAWQVVFADSEELGGDDGNAGNAIDGDPQTFWHTQWQSAKPAHPHRIVIDLGAELELSRMTYLPRQDSPNGRIARFRVYVSAAPFRGL